MSSLRFVVVSVNLEKTKKTSNNASGHIKKFVAHETFVDFPEKLAVSYLHAKAYQQLNLTFTRTWIRLWMYFFLFFFQSSQSDEKNNKKCHCNTSSLRVSV